MYDFLNRVDAQRLILESVNSHGWPKEPLMSLSKKSISRWVSCNDKEPSDSLVFLLITASDKLFFLANKSQEQITEDYKSLSLEVFGLSRKIKDEVSMIRNQSD